MKYVDVVYVNMRHEVARTERGRKDVIAPPHELMSVLYVEVKYVDVVYVNMRHEV